MDISLVKLDINANQAVDKLSTNEGFKKFLHKALGFPLEEFGQLVGHGFGYLGDRIKQKREQNSVEILQGVQHKIEEKGVDPKPIEPEDFQDIIEKASLSKEEDIKKLWVNLLTNQLDPTKNIKHTPKISAILSELDPLDAKILVASYNLTNTVRKDTMAVTNKINPIITGSNLNAQNISLNNLNRLGLINAGVMNFDGGLEGKDENGIKHNPVKVFNVTERFYITELGKAFIRAIS